MSKTFTTADDDSAIEMIRSARRRLAIIAPGVTTRVAKALAERMTDLPNLSLTVVVDADPEVYRMGFGDTEALTIIRDASKRTMFDLREQQGVRIGVIISDDRTLIYAPVSRNVEAGSTSAERPNAIMLSGAATETVAIASGTTPPPEIQQDSVAGSPTPTQEIGHQALSPAKVEKMEVNLKANPPRPFDLTRRLTIFVSEVQFVELRLTNAVLSSRKIKLLPHFLKFEDVGLRHDIESTLKIPVNLSWKLDVNFESYREGDRTERLKINESDLKRERDAIERTFFYDWKGRGKIIMRKDKQQFKKELARLLKMTEAYQTALKSQFDAEQSKFRETMVKEFLEFWKTSPPDNLRRRNIMDEAAYKQNIENAADEMFEKAVTLGTPEAKDVYKDISIEDLKDKQLMASLKKLMEDAGVEPKTLERLFQSGDAAAAQGALL
jgi:hypothetical protein